MIFISYCIIQYILVIKKKKINKKKLNDNDKIRYIKNENKTN